jgi:hypothetical protein
MNLNIQFKDLWTIKFKEIITIEKKVYKIIIQLKIFLLILKVQIFGCLLQKLILFQSFYHFYSLIFI